MDIMESVYQRAKARPMRVAFPEGEEEKIIQTARQCADEGICVPVLVGHADAIFAAADGFGIPLDGIEVVDAYDEEWLSALVDEYVPTQTLNSAKTMLRRSKRDCLYAALMMQSVGRVDVTFAGLEHSTGDVIMAGQMVVGLADGVDTVSSVGIFDIPNWEGSEGHYLGFGDSAVCADPDVEQLASIAISCCDTVAALVGWEPRAALLSYSTDGSAEGPLVEKVIEARRIANERRPDLKIDGEFQFDTAIRPDVAAKKVRRSSEVAGRANIVIWPDLNVGNVGVKLVQNFAHADAYGPMLQGFAKVVCDCSRSAPVSEIVGNVAMSCVRAQAVS